jgi:hypothetical protein
MGKVVDIRTGKKPKKAKVRPGHSFTIDQYLSAIADLTLAVNMPVDLVPQFTRCMLLLMYAFTEPTGSKKRKQWE